MIHIDNKEVITTIGWQDNIILAYLTQIRFDYERAIAAGSVASMTELEKHIMSGNYLGDMIGVSAGAFLRTLRHSYDKDKYKIERDPNTFFPVKVIKIKEGK